MKVCLKCKKERELGDYYKSNTRKDGLLSYCKICYKAINNKHYKNNSVKIKDNVKDWQNNNFEKVKISIDKKFKSIAPGVYMIKNLITGERYIGQSIKPYRRRCNHVSVNEKKIMPLHVAIKEYGKEAFVFGIIEHCLEEELLEKERYYITQLKPEYNICH